MTKTAAIGHNNPPPIDQQMREKHPEIFERLKKLVAKLKKANLSPTTPEDCAVLEKLVLDGRDLTNDADSIRTKEKEEPLRVCKEIDAVFNKGVRDEVANLVAPIRQAAADRRLAITREEQKRQQEEADRLAAEAAKLQERAEAQAAKGQNNRSDVTANQAAAAAEDAERAAAAAGQNITDASRVRAAGGHTASVGVKKVVTAVNKANLDLEALRPFLAEKDLIAAAQKAVDLGNDVRGAVIQEQAKSNLRR